MLYKNKKLILVVNKIDLFHIKIKMNFNNQNDLYNIKIKNEY